MNEFLIPPLPTERRVDRSDSDAEEADPERQEGLPNINGGALGVARRVVSVLVPEGVDL